MSITDAYEFIRAERQRQIEAEGWTCGHDEEHGSETLRAAAQSYRDAPDENTPIPSAWPFDEQWWKPYGRQRNLERAGALYLAAAEVADRGGDYAERDALNEHAYSCAVLLGSVLKSA